MAEYFPKAPTDDTAETKSEGDSLLAPALLILMCLLLGIVLAEPLVQLVTATVEQIQDPTIYINAVNLQVEAP